WQPKSLKELPFQRQSELGESRPASESRPGDAHVIPATLWSGPARWARRLQPVRAVQARAWSMAGSATGAPALYNKCPILHREPPALGSPRRDSNPRTPAAARTSLAPG